MKEIKRENINLNMCCRCGDKNYKRHPRDCVTFNVSLNLRENKREKNISDINANQIIIRVESAVDEKSQNLISKL